MHASARQFSTCTHALCVLAALSPLLATLPWMFAALGAAPSSLSRRCEGRSVTRDSARLLAGDFADALRERGSDAQRRPVLQVSHVRELRSRTRRNQLLRGAHTLLCGACTHQVCAVSGAFTLEFVAADEARSAACCSIEMSSHHTRPAFNSSHSAHLASLLSAAASCLEPQSLRATSPAALACPACLPLACRLAGLGVQRRREIARSRGSQARGAKNRGESWRSESSPAQRHEPRKHSTNPLRHHTHHTSATAHKALQQNAGNRIPRPRPSRSSLGIRVAN